MGGEKIIPAIVEAALEDWRMRRICLPSIVAAIVLHDVPDIFAVQEFSAVSVPAGFPAASVRQVSAALFPMRRDGGAGPYLSVKEAVSAHNTYLAEWKAKGQPQPNWQGLAGQVHYILAVQYLQDAQYPYYPSKEAERELVELIEKNGLGRYDQND